MGWGEVRREEDRDEKRKEKLTSMNAKDLIINNNAQRKEIEHIRKIMPNIRIPIFPGTLRIKSIRLRDTSRFMVSPDQMHAVWVSKFKTDEEGYRFYAEHAAVYIIPWVMSVWFPARYFPR